MHCIRKKISNIEQLFNLGEWVNIYLKTTEKFKKTKTQQRLNGEKSLLDLFPSLSNQEIL